MYANDASSSGNFSNAVMVCKPQQGSLTGVGEGYHGQRPHTSSLKRHKRIASEGSASLLFLHAGASAVRDDEDSAKDNTWRKLCRDFALPQEGMPASSGRQAFSPSAQGSAFRNWAETQKRLEQLVPSQAQDAVGSDATLQSTSSQSSAALSTSTNCSSSPQTDIDSVAEFFPNFPAASFRPFANGARSASPATSSMSHSTNLSPGHSPPIKDCDDTSVALPEILSAPRIVPVQLLDITGRVSGSFQAGVSPCLDSEHVFRPVTSCDTTDTESVTSYDTVIGPADWRSSEKPSVHPPSRQRSASEASSVQTRIDIEPVSARLSKTPPSSLYHSVQSSAEHLSVSAVSTRAASPHHREDLLSSTGSGEGAKPENPGQGTSSDNSSGKTKSRFHLFRRSSSSAGGDGGAPRVGKREHSSHETEALGRPSWRPSIANDPKQQNQLTLELRSKTLPLARHPESTSQESLVKASSLGKAQHSPSPPTLTAVNITKGSLSKPQKLSSSKPSSKSESLASSRASHSPVAADEIVNGRAVSTSPGLPAVGTDALTAFSSPMSRSSSASKKRTHVHRHSVSEMEHRRLPGSKKKREETSKGTRYVSRGIMAVLYRSDHGVSNHGCTLQELSWWC